MNSAPATTATIPWWAKGVPFILSGVLFLSGVFTLFSPLPILMLAFQSGRAWAWAAAFTNLALVAFAGGGPSAALYAIFVMALALSLPEFLKRKIRVENSALLSMGTMAVVGLLVVASLAYANRVNPVAHLRQELSSWVDFLLSSISPEAKETWLRGEDAGDWKNQLLSEVPSGIGIFALILVWANTFIVLRLNPQKLRESLNLEFSYFRTWKAPEYLLWPTIIASVFMIFAHGKLEIWGTNFFKFFMAIYAIQGLSILSFVFDVWKFRGLVRSVAYLLVVFLMLPLVLGIGFFDLWFDFRAKLRQS